MSYLILSCPILSYLVLSSLLFSYLISYRIVAYCIVSCLIVSLSCLTPPTLLLTQGETFFGETSPGCRCGGVLGFTTTRCSSAWQSTGYTCSCRRCGRSLICCCPTPQTPSRAKPGNDILRRSFWKGVKGSLTPLRPTPSPIEPNTKSGWRKRLPRFTQICSRYLLSYWVL